MPTLEDNLKSMYLSIDEAQGAFVLLTGEAVTQIRRTQDLQWQKIVGLGCDGYYGDAQVEEGNVPEPEYCSNYVMLGYEAVTLFDSNEVGDADEDDAAQPSEFLVLVMVEHYDLRGDSLVCRFGLKVLKSQAEADSMRSKLDSHARVIKGNKGEVFRDIDRFFGREGHFTPRGARFCDDEYGYLVRSYFHAVRPEELDVEHSVIIPVSQIFGVHIGWLNEDWAPPDFS